MWLIFLASVDLHDGLGRLFVSRFRDKWHVIFFVFIVHALDSLSARLLQIAHRENLCVEGLVLLGSLSSITLVISEGVELKFTILSRSVLVRSARFGRLSANPDLSLLATWR